MRLVLANENVGEVEEHSVGETGCREANSPPPPWRADEREGVGVDKHTYTVEERTMASNSHPSQM